MLYRGQISLNRPMVTVTWGVYGTHGTDCVCAQGTTHNAPRHAQKHERHAVCNSSIRFIGSTHSASARGNLIGWTRNGSYIHVLLGQSAPCSYTEVSTHGYRGIHRARTHGAMRVYVVRVSFLRIDARLGVWCVRRCCIGTRLAWFDPAHARRLLLSTSA